jgi:flavodoxin I
VRVLVVYDTTYGNTEQIARAIGEAVAAQVIQVDEVNPEDLKDYDLVIFGSPTHGGWYTEGFKNLFETAQALEGLNTAVFDTRTKKKKALFGYAAPRMTRSIEKHGGRLLALPEGFIVLLHKGPLQEGEIERAAGWAKGLAGL